MKKQGGQLAVRFDAHCCHLNIAEATELMTRLVKREVGGSADEPPDGCMQRRIQNRCRFVSEHSLGDDVIAN